MTNYFLNRLPEDEVCYWDLIFTDGSNQSRDSSAAAIGVCGIHEMLKYLPEVESDKNTYRHAMHCILRSLIERYTAPEIKPEIRCCSMECIHGIQARVWMKVISGETIITWKPLCGSIKTGIYIGKKT